MLYISANTLIHNLLLYVLLVGKRDRLNYYIAIGLLIPTLSSFIGLHFTARVNTYQIWLYMHLFKDNPSWKLIILFSKLKIQTGEECESANQQIFSSVCCWFFRMEDVFVVATCTQRGGFCWNTDLLVKVVLAVNHSIIK